MNGMSEWTEEIWEICMDQMTYACRMSRNVICNNNTKDRPMVEVCVMHQPIFLFSPRLQHHYGIVKHPFDINNNRNDYYLLICVIISIWLSSSDVWPTAQQPALDYLFKMLFFSASQKNKEKNDIRPRDRSLANGAMVAIVTSCNVSRYHLCDM